MQKIESGFIKYLLFFAVFLLVSLSQSLISCRAKGVVPETPGVEIDELEQMLKEGGIKGEVHAADLDNRQIVLTYRDPKNFFKNVQIGLVSHKKEVLELFSTLKRHDLLLVQGELFHRGEFFAESPQPHIEVGSIKILKKYQASIKADAKFKKKCQLPPELQDKNEADFLVHAVLKNGAFLVLEYRDNFVFCVCPDNKLSKDLYRNDRIRLRFKLQNFPVKPAHIELDQDGANNPILLLDSIKAMHGKMHTQEGRLVLFPKSPQIKRDIWAIEEEGPDGNSRTFTLVNFTKAGEQEKIDRKLKSYWDAQNDGIIDGRNKLVHTRVRLRARGRMNVVDPNQANPQMQLNASALTLL